MEWGVGETPLELFVAVHIREMSAQKVGMHITSEKQQKGK